MNSTQNEKKQTAVPKNKSIYDIILVKFSVSFI